MQRLTFKRINEITNIALTVLSSHKHEQTPFVFSVFNFGFKYIPSQDDSDHLVCWYGDATNVNVILPYCHPQPGAITRLIRAAFDLRGR